MTNSTITYGITVNNEAKEIRILLDKLIPLIDQSDEIVVLQDITNESQEVTNVLNSYGNKIKRITSFLDGDFATFKNNLIKKASKKYLFQIDADEYPTTELITNIKWFLLKNYKTDCFLVPRINIVNGITTEDINNWGWEINDKGYVNFPDFQNRIFRLKRNIRWQNKIHEILVNQKKTKKIKANEKFCLIHIKDIDNQKSQNFFYDTL
ncbi:hypothetical protein [Epilithonimonas sp.]|uniref:hypothetical protein n=1 Tax=Epilithonimonas sp. TaxID=2894511 RepID=UPI002FDC7CAB